MNVTNIMALIIAIITCFFGYKLNKVLIAILGLILGFLLGITYLPNIIDNQTIVYIISAIIAIISGLISYKLYLVGIFFLCAVATYILCENIGLTGNMQTIIGLTAGIIAGILGVKFTRPLMIISTSLSGGSVMAKTLFSLLNFQNNILIFIISLIFAILGMTYQFNQKDQN